MLITSLQPLLRNCSLRLDIVAGPGDDVTVIVIPRKREGAKQDLDKLETRPISLTASAAELDTELAKGADGALGQLLASRASLSDQISTHRSATEAARVAAADAAKARPPATPKPAVIPAPTASTSPPAAADPKAPDSLW